MGVRDLLRRLWHDEGETTVEPLQTDIRPETDADSSVSHQEQIAAVTAQLDDMEREVAVLAAQARLVRAVHDGGRAHGH